jgi:hypothetical protein
MMNEKLQRRVLQGCAVAIAVSYFLPWMSIMTPFGTVQLKGQFLDYAWTVLLLSILYMVVQFTVENADAFGVSPSIVPRLILVERIVPFLLLGFVLCAGANFELRRQAGNVSFLVGSDTSSEIRSGLDYGYWLSLFSATCLISTAALRVSRVRQFAAASAGVAAIAFMIAFATTRTT